MALSAKKYRRKYKMPPLDAPGMPPPGPDFLRAAQALGEDARYEKKTKKGKTEVKFSYGKRLSRLYAKALRQPGFKLPVEIKQGSVTKVAEFLSGHLWGEYFDEYINYEHNPLGEPPPAVTGPQPAKVMVIGKMPDDEEVGAGRFMVANDGQLLLDCLKKLNFKKIHKWYVTDLIKFAPPTGNTTIRRSWVQDCLPLLQAELRMVKPDYILLLGGDAAKAVISKDAKVGSSEGKVFRIQIPLDDTHDGTAGYHEAKAMVVLHPRQVLREEPMKRQLERGLARFRQLVDGVDIEKPESDIDHRTIYTLEDAKALIAEAEADLQANGEDFVAWDAEWHGPSPRRKGSYVRTIQFSWADRKSVCFVTADSNGQTAFFDKNGKPALRRLAKLCTQFMKGKRAIGHFLTADIEWLTSFGIDLRPSYEVPLFDTDKMPAFLRCRNGEGGADTAAMAHAIEETGMLGLDSLVARYTTAPPYHIPLEEFKKLYCKTQKIKESKLGGYGPIPDEILCPYANYDADVTRRLYVILSEYLDSDYQGHCCWEAFWDGMLAFNAIADMRHNGVMIDSERMPVMTAAFVEARDRLLDEMRHRFRWPEFNPRSVEQVKEVLFGEELNGRLDGEQGFVRLRPPKGVSLRLTPIVDTSKPPKRWEQIVENNLERQHSPSTGKSALSILLHETADKKKVEGLNLVRNFRFIDQVTKSVLRPPDRDAAGFQIIDDDGNFVYEKGLASCIDWDDRVRSFLVPTAETGRWKSSGPNMQNLSKNRDSDYKTILGADKYQYAIRSIVRAAPGNVLVEFDYKGAELLGAAVMADDALMIDHVLRNQLPDGEDPPGVPKDPRYYDIHSAVACMAFRLKCEPTKAGLKSIGKKDLRNIAKTVIFGLMYGRQARAIAMAAREQNVNISVEDAQRIIDTIYRMYPNLELFFQDCQNRAIEERNLCSAFGRWRRFAQAFDDRTAGEFQRQAMNFPIQSMIASALNRGLGWFRYGLRENGWNDVKIILAIHDAVLVECPPHRVPGLCDKKTGLIKWAMCDQVPIYPTTLDGIPNGKGPYHLGVSVEVSENWSEPVSLERGKIIGLDPMYCHAA